jgi:WXG100 family type VII secretion target
MSQFSVDTTAVGYTAASISTALATFDAQVASVAAAVNGVVGASWSGEAATAFSTAWSQWLASAEITRIALADISATLQYTQATYESTDTGIERANDAMASGMSS